MLPPSTYLTHSSFDSILKPGLVGAVTMPARVFSNGNAFACMANELQVFCPVKLLYLD